MLIEVAERLDAFVAERNLEARGGGWLALRACVIRLLGQTALLEANVPLTLAATNDVDVYADYDFAIEREFRRLLAARGRELDSLGSEIWMPAETEYSTLFVGHFITLLVADAASVLVSKALKAARKNRPLLTEYLARVAALLAACAEVSGGSGAVPMKYRATELAARAKARFALIARRRESPRYGRVLGRFVGAGLLSTNQKVVPHRAAIQLADALWAGEVEPRIFELLPALLIKKPSFFKERAALPDDLSRAGRALRRGDTSVDFRGIPGKDLARWVPRVGRAGTLPSRLRCFRLTADDSRLLSQLSLELGATEVDVLRRGLRELAAALLAEPKPRSNH